MQNNISGSNVPNFAIHNAKFINIKSHDDNFTGLLPEFVSMLDSKSTKTDKYEKSFDKVISAYNKQLKVLQDEEKSKSSFDLIS